MSDLERTKFAEVVYKFLHFDVQIYDHYDYEKPHKGNLIFVNNAAIALKTDDGVIVLPIRAIRFLVSKETPPLIAI